MKKKNFPQKDKLIRKNILIYEEQGAWLDERALNFSKYIRNHLRQVIAMEDDAHE